MKERGDWSEPAFVRPQAPAADPEPPPRRAPAPVAAVLVRYGLAAILAYFGALKVTAVAAQAMQPLVAGSPLLSWLYGTFGAEDAARVIGAGEIATALLLFASPVSAWLPLLGSLAAAGIFGTTLSFLITTPGTFVEIPGFPLPAPSAVGAFLLKDVFLFGLAVWSVVHAIRALRRPPG